MYRGLLPATRLAGRKILIEQNIKRQTGPAPCVFSLWGDARLSPTCIQPYTVLHTCEHFANFCLGTFGAYRLSAPDLYKAYSLARTRKKLVERDIDKQRWKEFCS